MTGEALMAIVTGGVGAAAGAAGTYVALRRDRREGRAQAVAEAEKTVELLEKQNALLTDQLAETKTQGEAREAEWHKRELEWKRREEKLERRINDLERDYRNLVLTVTTMGFCANAANCATYNPGDRRIHQLPAAGAEGTD